MNFKSSSGFYDQVTKPAFCGLTQGYSNNIQGIFIVCHNITINHDETGYEYNRTLFFNLSSSFNKTASVTVHLHHSTRNAQIQGGSTMPDKSKAAVWFLKNVVHGRIELLAHSKKKSVSNFNSAIMHLYNEDPQRLNNSRSCGDCGIATPPSMHNPNLTTVPTALNTFIKRNVTRSTVVQTRHPSPLPHQ